MSTINGNETQNAGNIVTHKVGDTISYLRADATPTTPGVNPVFAPQKPEDHTGPYIFIQKGIIGGATVVYIEVIFPLPFRHPDSLCIIITAPDNSTETICFPPAVGPPYCTTGTNFQSHSIYKVAAVVLYENDPPAEDASFIIEGNFVVGIG